MSQIVIKLKMLQLKMKWKKKNKNNYTYPKCLCDINKIDIGNYTYGGIDAESFGNEISHLTIGHFCSIAKNVRFILDGEHNYKTISTYPFKVRFFGEKSEAMCKGPIVIHDDVWIGERSIILSGVEIGQGAVIGAGSVVTHDIPPYAVFAGGEIKKYRFKEDIIKKLLQIDYSKITPEKIREYGESLYKPINCPEDVDSFLI